VMGRFLKSRKRIRTMAQRKVLGIGAAGLALALLGVLTGLGMLQLTRAGDGRAKKAARNPDIARRDVKQPGKFTRRSMSFPDFPATSPSDVRFQVGIDVLHPTGVEFDESHANLYLRVEVLNPEEEIVGKQETINEAGERVPATRLLVFDSADTDQAVTVRHGVQARELVPVSFQLLPYRKPYEVSITLYGKYKDGRENLLAFKQKRLLVTE
jgi:hypothetical protein